jgi:hypothetical protein
MTIPEAEAVEGMQMQIAVLSAALARCNHEMLCALEFLGDLEASDAACTQPESYQSAGFYGAVAGLRRAHIEARAALDPAAAEAKEG